ncbi:DUF473 domain-containing protein [Methanococcus voltae]|uniref:Uncharacterized protein n=2 Tax=Methanococcus voltae TaxID=2188 RepID=A0A8J7RMM0_METVO|nr:DUF473 domain-containing protein [Methanococcus voltae]MBP2172041.1 hypothetical protein [Methanococcus voltae]MBP2201004.1 hypothetical protein [Methanococcus voltae]MCS3921726.1 hypothetical protein [Methanococcus voltae PS]
MKTLAVTGISRNSISELLKNQVRTFVLKNIANYSVLTNSEVGDVLFLTSIRKSDLTVGTEGLIAKLVSVDLCNNIVTDEKADENETVVVNAQFEFLGYAVCLDMSENEEYPLVNPKTLFIRIKSIYG